MADEKKEKKVSFKDTLNLPRTDFPIRANAKENDAKMLERWAQEKLDTETFELNSDKEKYILHDGPPYANGHIHIGHAYNKILKDIVTKSQRMFGKHVPVTPGWDCHGLPIELKVSQENPGVSRTELKKKCREYARKWIDVQREEFKLLGVLMDWSNPYLTMNFGYESSTVRAFGDFVDQGLIERKNKTVPWCPSCETVLASAEIEYEECKDPSIYAQFPLVQTYTDQLFPELKGKQVSMLIWTTTPWTLPLNRAVLVKPHEQYVVLDVNGKLVIIAKALADKLCAALEVDKKVVAEFSSDQLASAGALAQHPFIADLQVPILADESVELGEGTAVVHSAPGAGPIDYEIGVKNKLEIYSPVGPDGTYTQEIQPKELAGMKVSDGQIWVLKKLTELDKLLYKTSLRHSYPHCWRCHGPLIFRATKQWFVDLAKDNIQKRAVDAIHNIDMYPPASKNRFIATVEGRFEWCISRQRVWGTPIPALICTDCDYTFITKEFVDKVAEGIEKEGIEYWDTVTIDDLITKDFACSSCKGHNLKKEQDILDVWFDSGVSHYAVLKKRKALRFPADIYLEGKDQHRGWFQSSLLTGMAIERQAPMKQIFTHGFTVDAKGRKMSKSLGNVVSPAEMIDKLGTDGLRLWASSIDNSADAVISDILIKNVQEVLRKIRNTARFLLSNLYDFDINKDAVAFDDMRIIDQYAMQELFEVNQILLNAYNEYDFTAIFHELADYCATSLSSFYLDIIKDRLYVEKADGKARRSAQTACWYILDTLTRLMAPILSFNAEQISDNYQKDKQVSIHLQKFADLQHVWQWLAKKQTARPGMDVPHLRASTFETFKALDKIAVISEQHAQWDALKQIRSAILKAIEGQREQGNIKHSLEAHVTVYFDPQAEFMNEFNKFLKQLGKTDQEIEDFFKEFLIVSQFTIANNKDGLNESTLKGLFVDVQHAQGEKCQRCWNWVPVTEYKDGLCKRCQTIVK